MWIQVELGAKQEGLMPLRVLCWFLAFVVVACPLVCQSGMAGVDDCCTQKHEGGEGVPAKGESPSIDNCICDGALSVQRDKFDSLGGGLLWQVLADPGLAGWSLRVDVDTFTQLAKRVLATCEVCASAKRLRC